MKRLRWILKKLYWALGQADPAHAEAFRINQEYLNGYLAGFRECGRLAKELKKREAASELEAGLMGLPIQ